MIYYRIGGKRCAAIRFSTTLIRRMELLSGMKGVVWWGSPGSDETAGWRGWKMLKE